MERVREEMEKVKEKRKRRSREETRENGTRGVQDRYCYFCTRFTKTGPNDLCDYCSGPRCSPGCEHLYNTNGRKQTPERSDKESEIVPETTRYMGNTSSQNA